jgi:nucleoid DNA-binding protein
MGNVTKKDIVDAIADRTGLTQVDTKVIVECFLDSIAKSLRDGKNIEIRGFGRFKVKEKKAREARNPRTGEMVYIEAGFKPVFEASKELKSVLNGEKEKLKAKKKAATAGHAGDDTPNDAAAPGTTTETPHTPDPREA